MSHEYIYSIDAGALKRHRHAGCKVDGHVHSRYSGREPTRYVGTPLTKLAGVRESYATPKKIHLCFTRAAIVGTISALILSALTSPKF